MDQEDKKKPDVHMCSDVRYQVINLSEAGIITGNLC